MILIFFGPPGAGKGTQASLLAKELLLPHLSTGDILRKKLLETDPLSLSLKKIMDSGNLVSDDILNKIIADRLLKHDCENGFILDGYPRTVAQNNFLNSFLNKNSLSISKIFVLTLDENIIVERIKSRSGIENRKDDKVEVIRTRINKYLSETKPLSDFYSENYPENYHVINGNQKIEMIHQDILNFSKK